MTPRPPLTCEQIDELAGLYVLDALGPDEAAQVRAHLADHAPRHAELTELAPATLALASLAEPVTPPPALRDRVMAAVAATPQLQGPAPMSGAARPPAGAPPYAPTAPGPYPPGQYAPGPYGPYGQGPTAPGPYAQGPFPSVRPPATPAGQPAPISLDAERQRRRGSGLRTIIAAAAVIAIVALAGWGVLLTRQVSDAEHRVALLREAIAAAADPTTAVAQLTGSGPATGANGYAVFPDDGPGFIVMAGMPGVPADRAWQAWFIADGTPASAGIMTLGPDGLAVLEGLEPTPGTSVVALTEEPVAGSDQPTTDPVVVGELSAPIAAILVAVR